jgi:hypothetical protein
MAFGDLTSDVLALSPVRCTHGFRRPRVVALAPSLSLVHLLGAHEEDWVPVTISILIVRERIRIKRMSGGGESTE